jgi:glycosyltransferase involved in cell wall biosynthesis
VRLVLVDWGRHTAESRALVEELGLADRVEWRTPFRKKALWGEYLRSHAVVDQFLTPAMGSVTFESLALGCRVITAIDASTVTEFFGSEPPLLSASAVEDIVAAIARIAEDPADTVGLGQQAAEWFETNHSTTRILELEIAAYRRLVDQPEAASRFMA